MGPSSADLLLLTHMGPSSADLMLLTHVGPSSADLLLLTHMGPWARTVLLTGAGVDIVALLTEVATGMVPARVVYAVSTKKHLNGQETEELEFGASTTQETFEEYLDCGKETLWMRCSLICSRKRHMQTWTVSSRNASWEWNVQVKTAHAILSEEKEKTINYFTKPTCIISLPVLGNTVKSLFSAVLNLAPPSFYHQLSMQGWN